VNSHRVSISHSLVLVILIVCGCLVRAFAAPPQRSTADLLSDLNSGDDSIRTHAAQQLMWRTDDVPAIVNALTKMLLRQEHADAGHRCKLSQAVRRKSGASVPALTQMLRDPFMRSTAIFTLIGIGRAATAALPLLLELASSESVSDRRSVMFALGEIGKDNGAVLDALKKLASDTDMEVRLGAAEALFKVKGDAELSLPILTATLQSSNGGGRLEALRVLKLIGPAARPALPALEIALRDEDEYVARRTLLPPWSRSLATQQVR